MSNEEYKQLIIEQIKDSKDIDYLCAVFTFAKYYLSDKKEE